MGANPGARVLASMRMLFHVPRAMFYRGRGLVGLLVGTVLLVMERSTQTPAGVPGRELA